jgi:hypothetical protein
MMPQDGTSGFTSEVESANIIRPPKAVRLLMLNHIASPPRCPENQKRNSPRAARPRNPLPTLCESLSAIEPSLRPAGRSAYGGPEHRIRWLAWLEF